jgi:hypothetical protein
MPPDVDARSGSTEHTFGRVDSYWTTEPPHQRPAQQIGGSLPAALLATFSAPGRLFGRLFYRLSVRSGQDDPAARLLALRIAQRFVSRFRNTYPPEPGRGRDGTSQLPPTNAPPHERSANAAAAILAFRAGVSDLREHVQYGADWIRAVFEKLYPAFSPRILSARRVTETRLERKARNILPALIAAPARIVAAHGETAKHYDGMPAAVTPIGRTLTLTLLLCGYAAIRGKDHPKE